VDNSDQPAPLIRSKTGPLRQGHFSRPGKNTTLPHKIRFGIPGKKKIHACPCRVLTPSPVNNFRKNGYEKRK